MPENQLHHDTSEVPATSQGDSPQAVVSHHASPKHKGRGKQPRKHSALHNVISFVLIFLVAGLLAWFLTVFVFQQYQVDGPSMETTLQNNNRLIVWKTPVTWSKITGHPYIPNRGDIVVFIENNLYSLNETSSNQLIKRVIGLPGDRVVVKNGVLTIYNKQHPNGFRPDATLPYGKVIGKTSGNIDLVVPHDQIFVCGDNRGDSLDSRVFGTVPVKNIVGKLILRITPVNEIEKF